MRNHLQPTLGRIHLSKLTVQDVQRVLNDKLATGTSVRTAHAIRSVLRAALSRAAREELVFKNVAKLVEIPAWHRKAITPWTPEQSKTFLTAAQDHRWYAGYLMLLSYGMRRGEVLGLRWSDIDFANDRFQVEQQLQRIDGKLALGPVKTEAGRRLLPLIPAVRDALLTRYIQAYGEDVPMDRTETNPHAEDLVLLSSTGTPVDPKNFVRTFHEIRTTAGLPRITVHHTRHTAATTLKNLHVPARDAQLILGHSHVTTTQQLYQHGDIEGQTEALVRVGQLLTADTAAETAVKNGLSTGESAIFHAFTPGGPGGARTLDTLLKSVLSIVSRTTDIPVIARLRTLTYARMLGRVAVKTAATSTAPDTLISQQGLEADLATLRAIRALNGEQLRHLCFPYTLIDHRPLLPRTSAEEGARS